MSDKDPYANGPPNLVDLIDRLVEPNPPASISMVPQTAGWMVLVVLSALAAAYGLYRYLDYRKRNAYRRQALSALQTTGADAAEIAIVLRRTALAAYPRESVAGLSGEAWLNFLDRTGETDVFSTGVGRMLATAPYQVSTQADPALAKVARDWISRHRVETGA